MNNKEQKRARYIYSKEQAGVILTESEQEFWNEFKDEYLNSDYHKEHDELSDEDVEKLRKYFRIPENMDVREFIMRSKRNNIRRKFADKLKPEEDGK